ncbi:hypothetical protein GCM10017781_41070 [Deinococcus metalli]|uniref:Uncharacterized protein n=1 Tax=Deinococcus metalli TaxID=1141878 RepID=A0ABQ3JV50_9DEIO|nr:hypothetical protein GCM10017781_41070 [Deinococcus metalli]
MTNQTKEHAALPPLAAEALAALLDSVRQKWRRYGAEFIGEAHEVNQAAGCAFAQTFVLDDVRYELVLDEQARLLVQEWVPGPGSEWGLTSEGTEIRPWVPDHNSICSRYACTVSGSRRGRS